MEIGANEKYNGALSTASTFILEQLTNNRDSFIQCLPVDDCISLMKMILLEIIPKATKEFLTAEVQQGSFSGIIIFYNRMKKIFKTQHPFLFEIIDFLENNRRNFTDDKLNNFIDQCLENRRFLFQFEHQQTDMNYFNDLTRKLFSL